jgi:hypothetical protein
MYLDNRMFGWFRQVVCCRVKHSQPEYGRTSVHGVRRLPSCSLTSLRCSKLEPSLFGGLESWKDKPATLVDGFMTRSFRG